MENLGVVIAALLLVALNGFFVAAEFGLVKLRQTRLSALAKHYGWRGRILTAVHGRLDAYLSACQLGITLASLALGWIGEPAFARLLEPVFDRLNVSSPELMHAVSIVFAFSLITFLHIVVGEQAPKSMAIRRPEQVSLWIAIPLYLFYWAMYPAIWILNASATGVLRLVGLDGAQGHETHYSADELKLILRGNQPAVRMSRDELRVVAHTLDFSDLEVSELMRPIGEVVGLHQNRTLAQNLDTIYHSRYSRYPYFAKDGETVLGIIHLKDLFLAEQHGKPVEDLSDYLRPAHYVAPTMPAFDLFRRFRKGAPHFAIVGHKGSKADGFITLDDMLGALVGGIRDEFRQSQNDWTRLDDETLIGKGSLPIFSLERELGIEIENESVDSIGGLVMWKLGDVPHEGQKIEFDQFDVVVKKMNGPRIMLVRVYPKVSEVG
ncbi:MAG: HlyC/CorC family transporter [Candidatus Competibacteraceae bacterium]|nr:HlyC/CorC family transporter [Candidatus Competibacteraceae bacterium]